MAPNKGFDLGAFSNLLASMGISREFTQSMSQDPYVLQRIMHSSSMRRGLTSLSTANSLSSREEAIESMRRDLEAMRAISAHERGLPAYKVPPQTKEQVYKVFSGFYKEPPPGQCHVKKTYIGLPWSYSQKRLANLKRVNLRDMYVRKTHEGRYFLGRVVYEISKIVATNIIIEDPEGHAAMLCVYNYPMSLHSKLDDMRAIFSVGSVWAVREPTYKFSQTNPTPIIRVDSPSDVVPVTFDDELLRTVQWKSGSISSVPRPLTSVEDFRFKGSLEFKAQRWLPAAVCYTDGLKLDKESLIMRLNRCEAYIRLGWFTSALYDANRAIEAGIEDSALLRKAVFRAAKASYYLKDYECTIQYADRFPNFNECVEWKVKAEMRVRERDLGLYDWCALYHESQTERSRPDIADFCGPVEVREGPDGIRGLFCTRSVTLGELLLASRPIASYYREDNPSYKTETIISLNLLTNEVTTGGRSGIIATVAQKMWDDEHLAALIHSMYAGPETSPPRAFILSVTKATSPLIHPLSSSVDIDISRIEGVASFNSFSVGKGRSPSEKSNDVDTSEQGTALFGLASLCNHSCLQSARRFFFGDVITIRAARPLKKGEEVTMEYLDGAGSLLDRDKLSKRWRFQCKCLHCLADRADGISACSLRGRVIQEWSSSKVDVEEAANKLDQIRSSYNDTPERRACGTKPILSMAYHKYSCALRRRAQSGAISYYIPYIKAVMDSLEAVGVKIIDRSITGTLGNPTQLPVDTRIGPTHHLEQCIQDVIQIVYTFDALNDLNRAIRWMKVASWLSDLSCGGRNNLFRLMYAGLIEAIGLSHIADRAL